MLTSPRANPALGVMLSAALGAIVAAPALSGCTEADALHTGEPMRDEPHSPSPAAGTPMTQEPSGRSVDAPPEAGTSGKDDDVGQQAAQEQSSTGDASQTVPDSPSQAVSSCDASRSATALHPGGKVMDPQPPDAPFVCTAPTGARAPHNASLQVTRAGTVIFAPADSTGLVRSEDGGATWLKPLADAPPQGELLEWAHPWVTRDPDTDKLFFTNYHTLGGTCGDGTGHHYWTSTDDGATWEQHSGGVGCDSWDWGKIITGPPATSQSREALAMRGYPNLVYFCAGGDVWAFGPQHFCFRSTDGGETFKRTLGSPTNGWNPSLDLPGFPNAGAIAPDGTFYKVFGSSQGVTVAISEDEADSWHHVRIPDTELAQIPGINWLASNVATDDEGNLYVVWVDDRDLLPYMVFSTDGAKTWSERMMVGAPEVRTATNINVAAFGPGHVAIVYYGSPDIDAPSGDGYTSRDGRRYHGYMVATAHAFADQPVLWTTTVNDPAQPTLVGISLEVSEYLGPPVLGPEGSIWAGFLQDQQGFAGRISPLPGWGR